MFRFWKLTKGFSNQGEFWEEKCLNLSKNSKP